VGRDFLKTIDSSQAFLKREKTSYEVQLAFKKDPVARLFPIAAGKNASR